MRGVGKILKDHSLRLGANPYHDMGAGRYRDRY
jgi:hypothetical protein